MTKLNHIKAGYCAARLLTDGKLCMNSAMAGDEYCGLHHPLIIEQRMRHGRAAFDRAAGRACRDAGIVEPAKELPEILRKWSELKNRSRK